MTDRRGWGWWLAVSTLAGPLLAGLALILALTLGWNNPRPRSSPDWEADGLPLVLRASPGQDAMVLLDRAGGDLSFEIVAAPVSGSDFNGYGALVRMQDEAHGYVFAVGSDGYYAVLRLAGGSETPLVDWQQFPHIQRGQGANRLRVTCAGPTCQFYINDEYASAVTDNSYLTGGVGLWIRSFEGDEVAVRFLEARVWMDH